MIAVFGTALLIAVLVFVFALLFVEEWVAMRRRHRREILDLKKRQQQRRERNRRR